MTSMVAADGDGPDVLALTSYPLHPPGKPERARTEHLPRITVPTVFTHGNRRPVRHHRRDPRGRRADLRADAGRRDHRRPHELASKNLAVPVLAVSAAVTFCP
jgi:predicted alpha/beta-hydrolase family hydrolase